MKISKRDKTILIVLFFVLVIGIFIMYGVVPANEELSAKQEEFNKLDQEVKQLKSSYNLNNPIKLDNLIEEALMSYYLNDSEDILMVRNTRIAEDDFFMNIIKGQVVGTNPSTHIIMEENLISEEGIDAELRNIRNDTEVYEKTATIENDFFSGSKELVSYIDATANISFRCETLDDVKRILSAFSKAKDYQTKNFNLRYSSEQDYYKYEGSIDVTKFYVKTPIVIPQPLVGSADDIKLEECKDAPNIPTINADAKELTFNTVRNALTYCIYKVEVDENGLVALDEKGYPQFTLVVSDIKANEGENKVTFKYDGYLNKNEKYVVTAVGNYKTDTDEKLYYRTIMSKSLAEKRAFTI